MSDKTLVMRIAFHTQNLAVVFALIVSLSTQAQDLKLLGASQPTIKSEALKTKLSLETLKTWEPHEKVEASFRGYNLSKLLELTFGKSWSKAKAFTFVCKDGYRAQVKIDTIKKYQALLATEWVGHDFKVNNGKKIEDLAPYYLVWEAPEGAETRGQHFWPWQIVGIEILN